MKFKLSLLSLAAVAAITSHAAITDIADSPLNTGGVDVIRPNIVLLFDDSGSMAWDYTPDWIKSANLCYTGSDTKASSFSTACTAPDPPFYNSDINLQFYNPNITYTPAINGDLTYKKSMTAANTTNWTKVPMDAYGQNGGTSTSDLTRFPTSYYCTDSSYTDCAEDTSYNLPEIKDDYAVSNGFSAKKRTEKTGYTSAAHYYKLNVWEHCKDEDLTQCIKSNVATGDYVYPSKLRYCTDTTYTNCRKTYSSATTTKYIVPNYLGDVSPASSTASTPGEYDSATLSVSAITLSSGKITSLKIDGQELAGTSGISYSTTSTSSLATIISNAINSGSTNFSSTVSGSTITIKAKNLGTLWNSKDISINAISSLNQATRYEFKITRGAPGKTSKPTENCIKTFTVNGTKVFDGSVCGDATTKEVVKSPNPTLISGYTHVSNTNLSNDKLITIEKTSSTDLSGTCSGTAQAGSGSNKIGTSISCTVIPAILNTATFSINGSTSSNSATGVTTGGINKVVGGYTPAVRTNVPIWTKIKIINDGRTFEKASTRTDCNTLSNACNFDEEMTNFANWYSYYRTRNQSAKTAAGIAFSILNDRYRVGYVALSDASIPGKSSTGNSLTMLGVNNFDLSDAALTTSHRYKWYNDYLYKENGSSATPSKTGLAGVGKYYAGKITSITDKSGVSKSTGIDPISYSCQKNYTVLVTDGYWNETNTPYGFDNTSIKDEDGNLGTYVSREKGVLDGYAASGTLSDVAQHYYANDLRPSMKNNVFTNKKDPNSSQHMNTYTMGLGIDGLMTYKKDYETATTGDFQKIISGSTGCLWTGTDVCNWPTPLNNTATAVDDLWHAAVNGRGKYFSAKNPKDVSDGLKEALSDIVTVTGAAASSATSSPNITQTDNYIFSTTYQTSLWDGEIIAQKIDTQNGNVLDNIYWKASDIVNAQADSLISDADARTLLTFDTTATSEDKKKMFNYSSLTSTEKNWFSGHCTSKQFSQCSDNTLVDKLIPFSFADNSENVINFLRGQNDSNQFNSAGIVFGYLDLFRNTRENRLGDTVNSVPLYINKPFYTFDYELPSGYEKYKDFKTRVDSRPGVLYIGANDGMLHAFKGENGTELFGYVPRTTMPEMWRIANQNYEHRYYVDGTAVSMDITDSAGKWRTILIGGYRKGGAGYYALDVTDPENPKVLWEVCNSSVLCNKTITNLGLSFGNPIMTRMPDTHPTLAGQWVALITSGYNNSSSFTSIQPTAGATNSGDGKGYLFVLDPLTGTTLATYSTGVGSTASPTGLGKLSSVAPYFYNDGMSYAAYAGDLLGNVWRFDLTKSTTDTNAVKRITTLKNASGVIQPITTRIEIGAVPGGNEPILFIGTGQYLSINDLADGSTQSIYAIKDPYNSNSALATGYLDNIRSNTCTSTSTTGCTSSTSPKPFVKQTVTDNTIGGNVVRQTSSNKVSWTDNSGWYMDLPDDGERISIDGTLALGTLLISSNVVSSAAADACSVGGYSWLYQLDYNDGSALPTAVNTAAAYKVPNGLVVGNVVIRLPSGILKTITTTASGLKIPYGLITSSSSTIGKRMSWREIPQ